MRMRILLASAALLCATDAGFAGFFGLFGGCNDCNRSTTTITMRPYNAFSPVFCGSMVCDGFCPFPFGMAAGGPGGHYCPQPSWSPCCPTPSFGGPFAPGPACGPCSTCNYPPASYYPFVSYYPPPPVSASGQVKGPQSGPQGGPQGHTSHYPGYYPQPYSGHGYGYLPAAYAPHPGYYYGQPGRY